MEITFHEQYDNTVTDCIKIQAIYDGKEIGHLTLTEQYDDVEYSAEFEGQIINDYINQLLDEHLMFYSLDYLKVNDSYKRIGIANKLLEYFQEHYGNKPTVLLVSAYDIFDERIKKLMNSKILPELYKKYGFKQIGNTNYYTNYFRNK